MANGDEDSKTKPTKPKSLGSGVIVGVLVVALGLGAVVWSLSMVLGNYDVAAAAPASGTATAGGSATGSSDGASVSASSVVAVLTPVMAGILGIVGLFFGVSASGSARGQHAQTEKLNADTNRLHAATAHQLAINEGV